MRQATKKQGREESEHKDENLKGQTAGGDDVEVV